jgi:glutathione S-transferase
MKLYYAPGACSLADHIALHEAGLTFERIKVDLKARRTADGRDYTLINAKGYVPALEFDDGQVLTENIAILSWISDQAPMLAPKGPLAPYRLLEMLAFISTEIHKSFKPFFRPDATEADKAQARDLIGMRLAFLAERLRSDFLLGDRMSVADAYLFVMLMWAGKNDVTIPAPLAAYLARLKARPAVRLAMEHEGLGQPAS